MELLAAGAQIKHERVCPDCKSTDFVEDHAAGDIVCRSCGLVVEAHIIDERSEWRTFGDKEKEGDDPSRVGAATNPLMGNGGLSTSIGKLAGGAGGSQYTMLTKLHNRQTGSDRQMQAASRDINEICERMKLSDLVRSSALEVFKDTQESKTLRGRANRAVYAACIFVAGKRENNHRTFKEICAMMPDVNKVDIGRCFTAIDKMYKTKAQFKATQAGVDLNEVRGAQLQPAKGIGQAARAQDLIKRYMSRLTSDKKVALFALKVAERAAAVAAEEAVPWASRDPSTQACAIMYGVLQINKLKNPDSAEAMVTWDDFSRVSGMAPNTIRDCYKSMLTFFANPGKLVLEADAKPEILQQLDAAFKAAPAPGGGDTKAGKKAAAQAAAK